VAPGRARTSVTWSMPSWWKAPLWGWRTEKTSAARLFGNAITGPRSRHGGAGSMRLVSGLFGHLLYPLPSGICLHVLGLDPDIASPHRTRSVRCRCLTAGGRNPEGRHGGRWLLLLADHADRIGSLPFSEDESSRDEADRMRTAWGAGVRRLVKRT